MATHRRTTPATPATPVRLPVVAITDARTRNTHLITDEAFTSGCRTGRYVATCGTEVLAASLTTPEYSHREPCTHWQATQ